MKDAVRISEPVQLGSPDDDRIEFHHRRLHRTSRRQTVFEDSERSRAVAGDQRLKLTGGERHDRITGLVSYPPEQIRRKQWKVAGNDQDRPSFRRTERGHDAEQWMPRHLRLDHGFDFRQIYRLSGLGDDEGIQACLSECLDRILDEHPPGQTNQRFVATEAAADTPCQHGCRDTGRSILDFMIRFHDLSFASTDLNGRWTRCRK